ncbi:MAG: hypothetical protein RMH81_07025 [Thermomicrobium sp.]|nr:hypothetical protein [Thermomicrobium sp.]
MAEQPIRDQFQPDDELFEAIQRFLAEQSSDSIDAELRHALREARRFIDRQLRDRPEYERMLSALERAIEDEFPGAFTAPVRARLAEFLYRYGLAHYRLVQGHELPELLTPAEEGEDSVPAPTEETRPLVIYDIWFPQDIALEHADDGYYLHISDGRIDLSLYLGEEANERGALTDLLGHYRYALTHAPHGEPAEPSDRLTPVLTVELDYSGSELVEANDHVDVLFLDPQGEPIVRMHARAAELRLIVEELQTIGRDGGL